MINKEVIIHIVKSLEVSALLIVIIIDIFLGISKAFIGKKLNSHIGLTGLIKHSVVIVLIITMGIFSPIFELQTIFKGLVIFYIFQYLLSIIESLVKMKVPLPKFLVNKINQLKEEEKLERYEIEIEDKEILDKIKIKQKEGKNDKNK